MLTARKIAQWFVAWADETEDADDMTPLKIQKLLYYAKGVHMKNSGGVPLFGDRMEAWRHGPVVPDLYHELKGYQRGPVDPDAFVDADFSWDDFRDVEDSLIETWQRFGVYSAWALRNKTHGETPWVKRFVPDRQHNEITDADLKEFFG